MIIVKIFKLKQNKNNNNNFLLKEKKLKPHKIIIIKIFGKIWNQKILK